VLSTGLDPEVQAAALDVMQGYRGSMVVIDTRTGQLLAMANRDDAAVSGAIENVAVDEQYEPGSVIKVLTALNAIDSNVSLASVFPLECRGYLDVDGISFRDWARHDRLPSLNEAMATSCNVAFAQLGFRIGAAQIDTYLTRAGFGQEIDLGHFRVPLGKLHGALVNRISVAESSVGLGHETINALHLGILADAVANGGALRVPRVVTKRVTLLGDDVTAPVEEVAPTMIGSAAAVHQVTEAMKAVVTDVRGTGRDAAVEGLTIAMKTGTAGTRPYNSLIMAFAPADHPRMAIGMIVEHAGPAEGEGARITHDFFEAMKPRLK
jgi:peptidoglycan glycosyltransferase